MNNNTSCNVIEELNTNGSLTSENSLTNQQSNKSIQNKQIFDQVISNYVRQKIKFQPEEVKKNEHDNQKTEQQIPKQNINYSLPFIAFQTKKNQTKHDRNYSCLPEKKLKNQNLSFNMNELKNMRRQNSIESIFQINTKNQSKLEAKQIMIKRQRDFSDNVKKNNISLIFKQKNEVNISKNEIKRENRSINQINRRDIIRENKFFNLQEQLYKNLKLDQSLMSNHKENDIIISNQKSDQGELPTKIDQSYLEKMRVQLEIFQKITPFIKKSEIIDHFQKFFTYISSICENKQNFTDLLNKQELVKESNQAETNQQEQQEILQLQQIIENQNKQIQNLTEFKNLCNQQFPKIKNFQEEISNLNQIIKNDKLQIQQYEQLNEQQKILHKQQIQENENAKQALVVKENEIGKINQQSKIQIQSQIQENENLKSMLTVKENELKAQKQQNDLLLQDLESMKQQLKQFENKQEEIKNLAEKQDQLSKAKNQQQIQENENLKSKLAVKESELKAQKQQNGQLLQNLENMKQQLKQIENKQEEINNLKKIIENNQLKIQQQESQQKTQRALFEQDLEKIKNQLAQYQQESVKKIFQEVYFEQDLSENVDQQVKQVLAQLNPETEIETGMVQFTKAHQIINKKQPDEQEKINLKLQNDKIVQQFQKDQKNIQKPQLETMQCLLALQSLYKQDGVETFITDQQIMTLEEDESYLIQQQYIQIGLHNQAFYFSVQIDQQSSLYQTLVIIKKKEDLNEFLSKFKNQIGEMISSKDPQKDIIIVNISFDKIIKIDFLIQSQLFNRQEIKKKLTFQDLGFSVSLQSLLEGAKLSVNMFNPQFNQNWEDDNFKGRCEVRGQIKMYNQIKPIDHVYHFPVGYKGIALNVDRYGEDKSWISQNADSKTWIILYHGTNEISLKGIIKDNLIPGPRNAFGGLICRITDKSIKEGNFTNIYLSDDLNVAKYYSNPTSVHDGKFYQIIFQCRVNPIGIKSPIQNSKVYVVEDNQYIRPYRILLKEYKAKNA